MARPFCRCLYLRIVCALGLISLAFFLASLDPFLHAAPIATTGASGNTPLVSVNRSRKGDRLPLFNPRANWNSSSPATWQHPRLPNGLQTQEKTPLGCDPAFSPVSSPWLSIVYGRCLA